MRTRGERDKIQWTSRNKSVLFFIYTHWQWDSVRQHANGKRVLSEMQPGYGIFFLRNLDMVHGCIFSLLLWGPQVSDDFNSILCSKQDFPAFLCYSLCHSIPPLLQSFPAFLCSSLCHSISIIFLCFFSILLFCIPQLQTNPNG